MRSWLEQRSPGMRSVTIRPEPQWGPTAGGPRTALSQSVQAALTAMVPNAAQLHQLKILADQDSVPPTPFDLQALGALVRPSHAQHTALHMQPVTARESACHRLH